MGKPTNKVGGYARFSPDDAAKVSIEMQRAKIKEVCESKGWELVKVLADEDLSGALPPEKRPGLMELLDEVDAGAYSLVMVYEVSRLARNQSLFWTLIDRMKSKGVLLATAMFPEITSDKPEFQMVAGVLQSVASFQREETKAKTSDALKVLKSRGYEVGRPPLGFRFVEDETTRRGKQAGHKRRELDDLGKKVRAMLDENPKLKAVTVARELGIGYMSAWHLLNSVRDFL